MYTSQKNVIHPHHKRKLLMHISRNIFLGFSILIVSLFLGMLGYHNFEKMSWVDAYVNAAMILSGMGPTSTLQTEAGKIFAGSYAIFSGVVFLILIAFILSPIIHWFFIKFHINK